MSEKRVANFKIDVEKLNLWMQELIPMESKGGSRAQYVEQFEGMEALAKLLETDLKDGLKEDDEIDFKKRDESFGTNVMPEPTPKSFLQLLWEAFQDLTIIILSVAAIVSLVLGLVFPEKDEETGEEDNTGWVEGVAILIAVLLVTFITAGQDWDKARKFRVLNKQNKLKAKVIRSGNILEINSEDIHVGDVIDLDPNYAIPCDGLLISGKLKVDESSMTGESDLIQKSTKVDPLLLSNTPVKEGMGRMLATAIGESSMWGSTLKSLEEQELEKTPLQDYLDAMAEAIGKIGLVVGILVFYVLGIYWAIDTADEILKTTWEASYIRGLVDAFIIGITVLVVAIPEGLPLAVTISLAYSMKAMLEDKVLVRHLASCETMGGATNICSDKTGTLTQNKMTVVEGFVGFEKFTQKRLGDDGDIVRMELDVPFEIDPIVKNEFIINNVHVNSTSQRQLKIEEAKEEAETGCCAPKEDKRLKKEPIYEIKNGNATEMSVADLGDSFAGKPKLHLETRKREEPNIVKKFGFNSTIKRMSTIVYREDKDVCRLYCKGAPDRLIKDTVCVLHPDGKITKATDKTRQRLTQMVEELSSNGLRTLLIAYRDFPAQDWLNPNNTEGPCNERYLVPDVPTLSSELTYVMLVGIEDPVRPEVPGAVDQCMQAGIIVRMVTGDYAGTAKKIAQQCNIWQNENDIVWTGEEFRNKSDKEVIKVLPRLKVLARSQPSDKHRIVTLLKEQKEVVAVTGDGTNDARALKAADVGLAMGIMGTEPAKRASDIIITDDNFNSIVKAVLWGRSVFENIRKFLQFQLTVNFGALVVAFIGAVSRRGAPLRAVQLLWVNLIMDTMAALALGTEKPEQKLMEQKPHGRDEPLLNNRMWKHIIGQGTYQVIILLVILYAGSNIWDVEDRSVHHYTLIFNAFVWAQIFNEINCRKIDDRQNVFTGLFTNWIFVGVIIITVILQILIVQFGGAAVKVEGINWHEWLACVAIGAFSIVLGFILRAVPVPERHFRDIFMFWKKSPKKKHVHLIAEEETEMNLNEIPLNEIH